MTSAVCRPGVLPTLALPLLLLLAGSASAEEFSFDTSEFEKKAYELNGYAEQKFEQLELRGDSTAYRLAYPGVAARDALTRSTSTLELSGKWNADRWLLDFRGRASHASDALQTLAEPGTLIEGGLRWSPTESLALDVGKRSMRWGKGYAWNPVGFVERPKDPNDTQLVREGFFMAGIEWVKSLGEGPLSSVGISALVLPVKGELNSDFGRPSELNPALKLYGLLYDTDIDLHWMGEGSKPTRFGFDFSRNLGPSFELHGEWARTLNAYRTLLDANGSVSNFREVQDSYLLGMRYITEREVTWVAEYYRNGAGYSSEDLSRFYQFADTALSPGASALQASKVSSLALAGYAKANPGRDYFYVRASAAEPFGWLYTTLALTSIASLGDGSYQITPEIGYTGFTNIDLRARAVFTAGGRDSEFGQKTAVQRLEAYVRWFF